MKWIFGKKRILLHIQLGKTYVQHTSANGTAAKNIKKFLLASGVFGVQRGDDFREK